MLMFWICEPPVHGIAAAEQHQQPLSLEDPERETQLEAGAGHEVGDGPEFDELARI